MEKEKNEREYGIKRIKEIATLLLDNAENAHGLVLGFAYEKDGELEGEVLSLGYPSVLESLIKEVKAIEKK